jgi:hypothetical protein
MPRFFPPEKDFHSLSIKDLLEAREAYHVYLVNMDNVIATAIGRYRIRKGDHVEIPRGVSQTKYAKDAPPKTLQNSEVAPWSWPCILVFVNRWVTLDEMKDQPDQVVPRFLYMPDGRMVPTCVLLATRKEEAWPSLTNLSFPSELMGGGYPIVTESQGQQHIASVGCLVTDGDLVYALTNKHVVGEKNDGAQAREIFTFMNGKRQKIGSVGHKQIGKKTFSDIYRGWPKSRAYSSIDAGTIRIDDINYWTAQIFGVGELGEPVDLHSDSVSVDLIGCPVRAFGAASGEMIGEIQALFYRYKSIGGFDYISDLLIGRRDERTSLITKPGDSGTIWCYDPYIRRENNQSYTQEKKNARRSMARAPSMRPIALQWGGHTLMDNSGEYELSFALATFLSTICRELDVDVVRGWNIGFSEYWGKLGHYKIAAKACELVSNIKLKLLMKKNLESISFEDEQMRKGELRRIKSKQFVPLADVPDLVWRASRKKDEANHFADMDEEGQGEFKGKTLIHLTKNLKNIRVDVWNRFYDSIGTNYKRGALPFRVWQIYKEMVDFVRQRDVTSFVCSAGILAHYIGDACQPLHVSKLHHGRNEQEQKVHAYYETQMLDRYAADIIAGVNAKLKDVSARPDVNGGQGAAFSVINLMRNTIEKLSPVDVVEAYNDSHQKSNRMKYFFGVVGERTVSCIAEGCIRLASIWQSAWDEGRGKKISDHQLGRIDTDDLKNLYDDKKFLEAFRLQEPEFETALADT